MPARWPPWSRTVPRVRAPGPGSPRGVWIGLEPDRLAPVCRLGHLTRAVLRRAAPARPQGIQRAVGGDPVEPGTDRRSSLELPETTPRSEQRLLEQVLCVLGRADDPVDVQLQLTLVATGQLAECVLVAGARAGEGRLDHVRILAPTRRVVVVTPVMTSERGEIRRSVFLTADASTNAAANTPIKGEQKWERS
jgi:hypothetical protein